MSLPVFPTLPGLTFTSVKAAEFNTLEQSAPNGYSVDISQRVNPMWHFTLTYEFLRDFPWGSFAAVSELRTMMGLFLSQSGKAGRFLFTDPDDYYVGPAMVSGTPNTPLAQLALVNDGAGNYYSPIQRTLDGVFYEDITDLNGSIAVYANGSLASAGTSAGQYTVGGPGLAIPGAGYMGMYLQWGSGSPPTGPITAEFNYYFRVKFEEDTQEFEKFLGAGPAAARAGQGGGMWTIGGSQSQQSSGSLKLMTARLVPR